MREASGAEDARQKTMLQTEAGQDFDATRRASCSGLATRLARSLQFLASRGRRLHRLRRRLLRACRELKRRIHLALAHVKGGLGSVEGLGERWQWTGRRRMGKELRG